MMPRLVAVGRIDASLAVLFRKSGLNDDCCASYV